MVLLQVDLPPSNFPFLFAAFAVAWVGFFAYAFFSSRRRQEMQRDLRAMQLDLDQQNRASEAED